MSKKNNSITIVNPFWIMLGMSALNLLVMHYYILVNCHADATLDMTSFVDNILGVSLDTFLIYFLFIICSRGNVKFSLCLCFIITWVWALSNIIYSRFFGHYISYSALGQGFSLFDSIVIKSVWEKIILVDMFFVGLPFLFIFLLRKISIGRMCYIRQTLNCICAIILLDIVCHFFYCVTNPSLRYASYFLHRMETCHLSTSTTFSQPIFSNFVRGSIRSVISDVYIDLKGNLELDDKQITEIKDIIESSKKNVITNPEYQYSKNIIFILVESYMSFTSDLIVDNHEVTPFLNSLKRDSSVYYNGNMRENVTIGESSDGQFIYMTGLLPLRSMITVSKAKRIVLPGLPKALGIKSHMVIPTVASMWNQDEMCRQYGFDKLYTSKDYNGGKVESLNDEQVFQLAMHIDEDSTQPFFSVILTLSMHQPYRNKVDPSFPITEKAFSTELSCYLSACHYTDRQIEMYFRYLRESGLYDKSLIVIAADHPVGNHNFGDVSDDIPLYIVNSGVSPKNMWQGECNQVDIYTTLLDLLGCKSEWYGLGHSLISSDYKFSAPNKIWDVSEWIIMGDYFSKQRWNPN